ncbi:Lar family restriction alleviation protein [Burkholderia seminalis]|uniref:Lar family restriction alleviation protein n=1 Tax=Burkholderia seminalis TaxID=488731 RepID=UPI002654D077|nr:Lar family restriction alleviation protein [Burkholderia seminalis]MDN7851368.1 Lar family restriction alleviation protein [Burkholderia seminalis]
MNTTDKIRTDAVAELLPCPFCGSTNLEIANTHTPSFWVRCNECEAEASGGYFPTPNGKVRHDRFSYSSTPNDTCFEANFDSLHPEYQDAFRSAVNAWNRRTPLGQPAPAPAAVITEASRAYPDGLTDTLRHVLSFPNFRCAPYAHLMRDSGADIDSRAEDEQAHVLHWLVKLVLDHGDRWTDVAEVDLNVMRAKARAAHDSGVTQ